VRILHFAKYLTVQLEPLEELELLITSPLKTQQLVFFGATRIKKCKRFVIFIFLDLLFLLFIYYFYLLLYLIFYWVHSER